MTFDINDLHRANGPDAVRDRFDTARPFFSRGPNGGGRPNDNRGEDYRLPGGFAYDDGLFPAPQPQLVKQLLPQRGTGLTIGQSGAGKTFVTVDLACAVASGTPFFGREVKHPGGVVYLAFEGGYGLKHRIAAAKAHRHIEKLLPLVFSTVGRDLTDDDQFDQLIRDLRQINLWFQQRYNVTHKLTILDTISAGFGIRDENSNAEITAICKRLQAIADRTGAFTLAVHHMGKTQESGARGASAWRGNVDNIVACVADRNELTGETKNRRLNLTKYRDGPEGPIGAYDLVPITLSKDEDGEPFEVPAVQPNANVRIPPVKPTKAQRIFDDSFNEALISHGKPHRVQGNGPVVDAVAVHHVREQFQKRYATGEDEPDKRKHATKMAFLRALKDPRYATEATASEELIWRLKP